MFNFSSSHSSSTVEEAYSRFKTTFTGSSLSLSSDLFEALKRCINNHIPSPNQLAVIDTLTDCFSVLFENRQSPLLWLATYLTGHPQSPLTERQLLQFWAECEEICFPKESLTPIDLDPPSVDLKLYFEDQITEKFNQFIHQIQSGFSSSHESSSSRHRLGWWVRGVGKSTALAWIYRALLQNKAFPKETLIFPPLSAADSKLIPWLKSLDQYKPSSDAPCFLLLDDFDLIHRSVHFEIARLVSLYPNGLYIIWTGHAQSLAPSLAQAFPTLVLDLSPWDKHLWTQWTHSLLERAPFKEHPLSLGKIIDYAQGLTASPVDQLRCASALLDTLLSTPHKLDPPSVPYGELETQVALFGPRFPLNALSHWMQLNPNELRNALFALQFKEEVSCPHLGPLFSFPSLNQWVWTFKQSLTTAHHWAPKWLDSLEQINLAPLKVQASLNAQFKRLRYLSGTHLQPLPPFLPPTLSELQEGLDRLSPILTSDTLHQYSLKTVCGLALEWGQWGIEWKQGAKALQAVQLGVAASHHLGDPLWAGRLMMTLSQLYLRQGLGQEASELLPICIALLHKAEQPNLAYKAQILYIQSTLQAGQIQKQIAFMENTLPTIHTPPLHWSMRVLLGQSHLLRFDPQSAHSVWKDGFKVDLPATLKETLLLEQGRTLFDLGVQAILTQSTPPSQQELQIYLSELQAYLESSSDTDPLPPSPMGPLLFKAQVLLLAILYPSSSPTQHSPTSQEIGQAIDYLSNLGERAYQNQNWSLWLTVLQMNTDLLVVYTVNDPSEFRQDSSLYEVVQRQKTALIQGIRLVGQLKDRLRLIHLYTRLGLLDSACGQHEMAQGSATLVLGWIETLDQPSLIQVEQAFPMLFQKSPPKAHLQEAQNAISQTLESWTMLEA